MAEDARYKLQAIRLAVEELQSRKEDGIQEFNKDEAGVGRLLRGLDALLNTMTYDAGGSLSFLDTALQSFKPSSAVAECFQRAKGRGLPSDSETFRLWIVFALAGGVLAETLSQTLAMRDLLIAFYVDASPVHDAACMEKLNGLLGAATMHPLHGTLTYRLDVTALSLFEVDDAPVVVRRRAATIKPKGDRPVGARRKTVKASAAPTMTQSPSSQGPLDVSGTVGDQSPAEADDAGTPTDRNSPDFSGAVSPSRARAHTAIPGTSSHHHHQDPSASHTAVTRAPSVEISTQTGDESAKARARLVDRDSMTDEPAPRHTYAELIKLEGALNDRDRVMKETAARLQRESEDLEEAREDVNDHMDNVVNVLKALKALYNHHFMIVKDAQDSGRDIDRDRLDEMLPRIVAVMNGAPVGSNAGAGPSPAAAAADTSGVGAGGADSSAVLNQSSGGAALDTSATGMAASPTDGSCGSFAMVEAPGRPRAGTASFAGSDGRMRAMSTLPAPDTAPVIPTGSRPWRISLLTENERGKQLQLQHYRCAACQRDLPNPSTSNFLAKAVQRASKPRRCHYSGELYCHECHTNKRHVLPFLAVQQWDFGEQHVSDRDHKFLSGVFTKPMVQLAELPTHIRTRPVVQQAAKLRTQLARMYAVLYTCPDARTAFGPQLTHYYFLHEKYYSIKDLMSLRDREDQETGNRGANLNRLLLGSQGVDVVMALEGLVRSSREHILSKCHHCRSRAVKRCTLCGDADPVLMFENGASCPDCGGPFHVNCLALGCTVCDAKRHAASSLGP